MPLNCAVAFWSPYCIEHDMQYMFPGKTLLHADSSLGTTVCLYDATKVIHIQETILQTLVFFL